MHFAGKVRNQTPKVAPQPKSKAPSKKKKLREKSEALEEQDATTTTTTSAADLSTKIDKFIDNFQDKQQSDKHERQRAQVQKKELAMLKQVNEESKAYNEDALKEMNVQPFLNYFLLDGEDVSLLVTQATSAIKDKVYHIVPEIDDVKQNSTWKKWKHRVIVPQIRDYVLQNWNFKLFKSLIDCFDPFTLDDVSVFTEQCSIVCNMLAFGMLLLLDFNTQSR